MAAVAEARSVMKPPETLRSRTPSIGLAKASKDDRRTIVGLECKTQNQSVFNPLALTSTSKAHTVW